MFKKLGISEAVLKAIEDEKFEIPSEIQRKAIPLVLQGKDVIAGSATGSGKTLVFGAGIIRDCEKGKGIQALILTPTRELAEQVSMMVNKLSRHKSLNIIPVYGGVSIGPQIDALGRAEVVVGTPGRILDHLQRDTLQTDNVKILVLDEADRMLDMGFIDDVEKIIMACPPKRQTLLFSATISPDIAHLAKKYMHNPVEVAAEHYVDPSKMHQVYYDCPDNMKFSLLVHLLSHENAKLVMVFCNTRKNVDFVVKNLRFSGLDALAVHGGYSQEKRNRVMKEFHSQEVQVLVCTDVAARGLDIKRVSHVYNYDIPKDSKEYIHRIGRTARAGKEGKAISIVTSRDYENFGRDLKQNMIDSPREEMPYVQRMRIRWMEDKENYRGGFHRGRSRGEGRGERRDERGYSRGRSYGERRAPGQRAGWNRDNDRRSHGERGDERRDIRRPNYGRGRFSSGRSWRR